MSSAIKWFGENTSLVEQPDSPQKVFSDKSTIVKKYRGAYSLCVSTAPALYSLGTGALVGWYVAKVTINHLARGVGELIVEWGVDPASNPGSIVLPRDEVSLNPYEINPRVERHPMFAGLSTEERQTIRLAVDSQDDKIRADTLKWLSPLAQNLAGKLIKGAETYYMAGWVYSWTQYGFFPTFLSAGGVRQTPLGPLAGLIATNPSVHWLRQADTLEQQRQYFKLTSVWIGSTSADWDSDLYPTG